MDQSLSESLLGSVFRGGSKAKPYLSLANNVAQNMPKGDVHQAAAEDAAVKEPYLTGLGAYEDIEQPRKQ